MVMRFCEEGILVEGNEVLVDAEELVEGKELVEGNELLDVIELVEEIDDSNDVSSDVDETNDKESLEDRLGNGIEVHPVNIPVSQVNKMIGWMVCLIMKAEFMV